MSAAANRAAPTVAWLFALGVGCGPKSAAAPDAPPPATLVEISTGSVSAPDREAVLATLGSAVVRPCFEAALAVNPTAWGEVVVRFVIAPDGAVSEAVAAFSTLGDASAEGCVAEAVSALHFAPRPEALLVRYPFVLITERTPPEVARALKDRYGLLSAADREVSSDPRVPLPRGVVVIW